MSCLRMWNWMYNEYIPKVKFFSIWIWMSNWNWNWMYNSFFTLLISLLGSFYLVFYPSSSVYIPETQLLGGDTYMFTPWFLFCCWQFCDAVQCTGAQLSASNIDCWTSIVQQATRVWWEGENFSKSCWRFEVFLPIKAQLTFETCFAITECIVNPCCLHVFVMIIPSQLQLGLKWSLAISYCANII